MTGRSIHAAGALLLLGFLTAACGSSPTSPSTLTYGLTLAPTGIDPHLNASAELGIPLSSVYDTLVVQDPSSGTPLPGLAERWEISEDSLTYTFHLRDGVRFHDGTTFEASDVVANLDYTVDPDHHSQKAAFLLGPYRDAVAVDRLTVAIHLAQPYAPLLDSLSQVYLGMASPEALAQWGPAEYQFHQVGTGPYRFVEYVPNDHVTLERNPDYAWASEIVSHRRATYDRIVFRFYEDVATRALALENGEVDILGEIPPRDAVRLDSMPGFTLLPVPIPGQPTEFLFNTGRAPTDDVDVRTALIEAVDRPKIVQTVFGASSPVAHGPLSAGLLNPRPAEVFPGYDPDEARRLLDDAGWTAGDDGKRSKDGVPLSITIVSPPWGNHPDVALLLASAWEAVGVTVRTELSPSFGLLKEAQTRGDYNLIGINFFGTDPDLLRAMYSSDGLYNWTGYRDAELDVWLEEAAASGTATARSDLYHRIGGKIRDEALILPIRDYTNLVVYNDRVSGLSFSYPGWFPLLIDLLPTP